MGTSVYFNNYSPSVINENLLLEDLIVESIQIMGHDIRYLPREVYDQEDDVLGESVNSKFTRAYNMEMYIANVEGYEGDGDFFSKFGLEIRDTSNFVVSRRAFEKYVPSQIATRPREGDLIFVPVMNKIFEIKFVEEELLFFSLGKRNPYVYELRCEVFRYSNEDVTTGVEEIDQVLDSSSYTIVMNLSSGSGNYNIGETVYQGVNSSLSTASGRVVAWDSVNRKLDLVDIRGQFVSLQLMKGVSSNATYTLANFDELGDTTKYDDSDNRVLQDEAQTFIDLSEINPFGVP